MPGVHAILSPSAAHRWMNCTAAPRLEEKAEDKGSTYAEEGTLAHAPAKWTSTQIRTLLSSWKSTTQPAKRPATRSYW